MSSVTQTYDLHGRSLRVCADNDALIAPVDSMFARFAADTPSCDIHVDLHHDSAEAPPPPPDMRCFWSGTMPQGYELSLHVRDSMRRIDMPGAAWASVNVADGHAEINVRPTHEAAIIDGCLLPITAMLLAEHGQFMMHAAAVMCDSPRGREVTLICGASGAGKSTTSLALASGGMTLLSDDVSFIRRDGESLRAWGLLVPSKVSPRTIELLPWLGDLPRGRCRGSDEYAVDVSGVVATAPLAEEPVANVVFLGPRSDDGRHKISPVDRLQAMKMLCCENVRAYETAADGAGGRTFAVMAELVRTARTWQLSAGPRVETLAQLIKNLPRLV